MSTTLVHVLTVIGKAAEETEATAESLLGGRVQTDRHGYGSDDWSAEDHGKIRDFCTSLIDAANHLPVFYYARYLDAWSIAHSYFRLLEWPDGRRREVCGSDHGFAFYSSRHRREFLAQIERWQGTEMYRTSAEDRWNLDHIREAILAGDWLEAPTLIVCIGECLGPSRLDEEISAALDAPLARPTAGDSRRPPC